MTRKEFGWRMLKQSLLQKKAKALLIVLAVTMGASVVAALLNVQTDLRTRMNRELRDYGPNVVLLPATSASYISPEFFQSFRDSALAKKLIAFTPQLFVPVKVNEVSAILAGVDLEAYRKLYPSQEWSGNSHSSNDLYIGRRLASKLKIPANGKLSVQAGDRQKEFHVAGFVESGESEDDQLFVSLSAAQDLSGGRLRLHAILCSALGSLQEVQDAFRPLVQNREVQFQVIRKIAATESLFLDKISRVVGLIILFIFIILFFCIHTTVSTILISRQAEIALMRVLGARRKQITMTLTSELVVLGVVGGITGYAVGMLMAQVLGKVLFQAYVRPSFLIFVVTLFFSLILMVVSSLRPIARAVNRQAALVLKEA